MEQSAVLTRQSYTPHIALCAMGVATFAIALLVQTARTFISRTWFTLMLVVACLMELLGYIFRTLSSKKDPYRISFFVAQYFLITTSPILITATLYLCLTRAQTILGNVSAPTGVYAKLNKPRLLLWVFIVADIVTTIIQVTGAGLIGSTTSKHKDPTTPNNIVLAGIAVQTFFFVG